MARPPSIAKIYGAILLVLALCLALPLPASASAPPSSVPLLKVGYTSTPGQFLKDDRGLYQGVAYEYISTVASYMGCRLEFHEGTPEENLQKLRAGELDLVPCETPLPDSSFTAVSLGASMDYAVIRSDNPALAQNLAKAVAAINELAPFYQVHLIEHYAPALNALNLTPEEQAYLEEKKVLHSLTSEGQPPYTYFKEGVHQGVVADILDLIAKDLGVTITSAPMQDISSRLHAMSTGQIDFIADIYTDYNWAEENEVWLTKPYIRLDYVPVMRRDVPLPEEPVIACARGHFYNRAYIEQNYPSSQIRYYATLKDALQAVSDGKADLIYLKGLTVHNDIHDGGYLNLYTPGTVVFSHNVSIGVSRYADPRLFAILNKAVSHLQEKQITSILTRHMHSLGNAGTIYAFIYYHPIQSMAVLSVFCLLIILCLVFFMLQKRRYHEKMYKLAHTNSVIGLHNLRWLNKELPRLIGEHSQLRKEGKLFLMSVTIDRISFLKKTYETRMLIKSLLKVIKHQRMENDWLLADAVNSEVTSLYILCQTPEGMDMRQAAQKFILEGSVVYIGKVPTNFTYRIGLAPVPAQGDINPAWLIDCCRSAQTEAIASDRSLVIYDEALANQMLKRQEMEHLMYKAMASREFQIWLQPKYDLKTKRTIGAEALVRWNSPELGFLLPSAFMDLFEKNGFAVELDYHVLELVCELQAARLRQSLPVIPIAVNQTGLHISEQGYIGNMREIIDRWRLPAGLIELEITETAFIDFTTKEQRNDAAQIIDDLQEIGFSLSMDDFCTGYSSLSMLQNLPMNVMKIDRSILIAAESTARSFRILRHVIALGKALSMNVLAEGIETEEQEKHLIALGCDSGQGFLYARPMPAQEFYEEFLPKHS